MATTLSMYVDRRNQTLEACFAIYCALFVVKKISYHSHAFVVLVLCVYASSS